MFSSAAESKIDLKIVICGEETVVVTDSETPILVNELTTIGIPIKMDNATIHSYFKVASAGSTWCGSLNFSVYDDSAATTNSSDV